ncbi:MAG TPA: SufD family Fe-S cluster assembly protein [Thermohalobaculum sp.]|nr:SufD family Fe-S cluster assembly protein [Thermohalobaculum sp.]
MATTLAAIQSARERKRTGAEAMLSALPLPGGEAGWARAARAAARGRFLEAGAPVRRDEYWKYTDPTKLTAPVEAAPASEAAPELESQFGEVNPRRARFVDGCFRADLSDDLALDGLTVAPLGEVLHQDISFARELFGQLEAAGSEKVARPLAALNTACATEGLVLHATGPVPEAIHLRHDQTGDGATLTRHLIRVESGASLMLLQSGVPTNEVIEVDVADGGSFQHVRVQTGERRPAAAHLFARLGAGSRCKTFTLTADGELTRNEIVMEFAGDDAVGHIAGAVLGKAASHIDNTIFVTHGGVGCESRQVFKNVLADKAQGVFQGKIFVRRPAQRTDGYQISQAVLLNEGAEFRVKPELEIWADDVKCSHGATTGRLDEDAMFYLRARGIGRDEAEAMLVAAFAEQALMEIEDETLADAMRAHIARWMAERSAG